MFLFRPNPSLSFRKAILLGGILILSRSLPAPAYESFSDNECVENTSKIAISHKGKPFGLTNNIVQLDKNKCVIKISYEKLKFLKDEWVVDICRGPIHIKKGTSSIEVLKREGPCQKDEYQKTVFCQEWKKIKQIIQDDGLIFAEGEKENLTSDHGKIYCSYLLIKKYLQDAVIFSRGNKLSDQSDHALQKDTTQFPDEETPRPAPSGQVEAGKESFPEKTDKRPPLDSLKF